MLIVLNLPKNHEFGTVSLQNIFIGKVVFILFDLDLIISQLQN